MSHALFDKWLPRAMKIEPLVSLPIPLAVLLDEAPVVAAFVRNNWEPPKGGARPGLKSAAKARPMAITWSPELADEILELQAATQHAQNQYVLASQPKEAPPTERAELVLGELTAVLEWYFDDGVEDAHDAQLATLATSGEPSTIAELAAALEGYAAVAREVKDKLKGVIGFDAAMVDEAPTLAQQLRERSVPVDPTTQAIALDRRRRMATLLHQRMQLVRNAARVVYRHHPAIAREVASAYESRRRASAKRKAAAEAAEGATPSAPATPR